MFAALHDLTPKPFLSAIFGASLRGGAERPFLGEILVRKGFDVCTVMQVWDGKGGENQKFESSDAISEVRSAGVVPPGE